jgi:hypothetical protein
MQSNQQPGAASMTKAALWLAAIALVTAAGPAAAKDLQAEDTKPPEVFTRLIECRALSDAGARLACYDARTGQLQAAQEKHDIVVIDRAAMQDAKKGLFGLSLPQLKLFGSGGENDIAQLDGTVEAASQYDYGRWRLTLSDGSVWDQIDTEVFVIDPRKGNKVEIKRASMGGFKASVNGQPTVRVRRIK